MSVKVFWDTETTGTDILKDRIVSIACVVADVENKKVLETYYQEINPEMKNNHDAFLVHGLSDEYLSTKPKFHEVYKDILDVMCKYNPVSLLAHNADFDTGMLSQEFFRLLKNHDINIMDYIHEKHPNFIPEIHKQYHYDKEINSYNFTIKEIDKSKKNHFYTIPDLFAIEDTMLLSFSISDRVSLDALAKQMGVDASARSDRHDALVDTHVLYETYLKIVENYGADILTMERKLKGMDRPALVLNNEDMIPLELSQQLIEISDLSNSLSLNSGLRKPKLK